jgi:hypothetical protein
MYTCMCECATTGGCSELWEPLRHGGAALGPYYMFGNIGSNVCPVNSVKITDVPTCRAAAASMGLGYSGSGSYSSEPSGCEWYSGAIWLNLHATGAGSSVCKPLCAGAT